MVVFTMQSLPNPNSSITLKALTLGVSALVLAACGGGGSSSPAPIAPTPPAPTPTPPPATPSTVTLSGKATFDRVPFGAQGTGLNFNAIVQEPIREAVVELLNSADSVIATTRTDTNGDYSFTVDSETSVRVRVRAQMLATSGSEVDTSVLDNTSNSAPYVLDGSLASTGTANQTRNLNADSGWTGSDYTQTRAAAPFAILDTIYETMEAFRAADPDVDFPRLEVLWSVDNRSVSGNVADGEIGTSSFTTTNGVPTIRILGDFDTDADEFDEHVISHEFGHYFENVLGRSDSLGGQHSLTARLDPRVALGEGWGNALAGFVSGQIYRDSFTRSQSDFQIDLERNAYPVQGWFSEASVQSVLYDVMDSASDGPDTISAGLLPLYDTFIDPDYKDTPVATTIFAFQDFLRQQSSVDASVLDALLDVQDINGRGIDGTGETNDGGIAGSLPVYRTLTIGGPAVSFCSVDDAGDFNRLGNRTYFLMDVPTAQSVNIRMERT
ncbi:MAG: carboxypeptidase-like regulatory domain-containing protein, partial [Litorimonas sp.]